MKHTHLDLFSGIGGFALAAQWAGGKTIQMVEIDLFCQKVLAKNFPNVPIHGDIKTFDGRPFNGKIDLLTGGVPCQPASDAGKRRGTKDDRWLWGEAYRIIREAKPTWVILENVRGILSLEGGVVFENLLSELESYGYETRTFIIPACAVNAPHRRDRVWIVGFSAGNGQHGAENREGDNQGGNRSQKRKDEIREPQRTDSLRNVIANPEKSRSGCQQDKQGDSRIQSSDSIGWVGMGEQSWDIDSDVNPNSTRNDSWTENWVEVATRLCSMDDGISDRLVRPKGWRVNALKATGNAVVPQVAFEIIKAMLKGGDAD